MVIIICYGSILIFLEYYIDIVTNADILYLQNITEFQIVPNVLINDKKKQHENLTGLLKAKNACVDVELSVCGASTRSYSV